MWMPILQQIKATDTLYLTLLKPEFRYFQSLIAIDMATPLEVRVHSIVYLNPG